MSLDDKDFYSVKEFAFKTGLHTNTVRKMIKNGKINALQMGSETYSYFRIPKTELNRLAYQYLEKVVRHFMDKNEEEEKTG